MIRFPAKEIKIGNRPLGGQNPIRLQSMTNTPASDVRATVEQAIRIFEAGADYVRISVPNRQSALGLEKIRRELTRAGFCQPLVADIHFNADLALIAARMVEKVRINPGNYTGIARKGQTEWSDAEYVAELEKTRANLAPLIEVCREYGTAIRIGTNAGSLSPRIISRFGNTPEGLVQSTIEFLKIFEDLGFFQTVISLKASNPLIMIRSYLLMAERMLTEGMQYPMHVGVTEAGEGLSGRIKSALGICTLLKAGIGDTIRVSLSEPPENEIPFAQKLVTPFQKAFGELSPEGAVYHPPAFNMSSNPAPPLPGGYKAIVVEKPAATEAKSLLVLPGKSAQESTEEFPLFSENEIKTSGQNFHTGFNFIWLNQQPGEDLCCFLKKIPGPVLIVESKAADLEKKTENVKQLLDRAGIRAGLLACLTLEDGDEDSVAIGLCCHLGKLLLERKLHGFLAQAPNLPGKHILAEIGFELLQATGLRYTQTEFISCPTCARTSFDLQEVIRQVKQKLGNRPGIKIAVMGCVVNGPGEMADADFGILGAGQGKVHLYKGTSPVFKNIDQHQAADYLLNLIKNL